MKILIACEESQTVCKAFRERGHQAFSADIQPCSGGHPEWHFLGNCMNLINGNMEFMTQDGTWHIQRGEWDMLIAHPPCTFLTVAANKYYNVEKYGVRALQRAEMREQAAEFFMRFVYAKCQRIAIENPVGVMSTKYQKPTQIIQPYQFGHPARKATCLWLKGLPLLAPTNIVIPEIIHHKSGKTDDPWHYYTLSMPADIRAKLRSKTFPGIAAAMAEQWGEILKLDKEGDK